MKELLQSYAVYNQWANHRILEVLKKLPAGQLEAETGASFGSIHRTCLHVWGSESVWYQRVKLVEYPINPADDFEGTFSEVASLWEKQSALWIEWVRQATPVKLEHVVAYHDSRKQYYKSSVIDILTHVFNHATYHRGQLVTLLRQSSFGKIPDTDYSVFARSRKM